MKPVPSTARVVAGTAVAYLAMWIVTRYVFIADAPDYASDILNERFGESCSFFEFGHLAWRPLGYLVSAPLIDASSAADRDAWLGTLNVLHGLAGLAGLGAVVTATLWMRTYVRQAAALIAGVAVFLIARMFVNYAHVGSPYMPALCALCTGLWLGARGPDDPPRSTLRVGGAGVALGSSALLWGPFLFALPGAVLAPLLLERDTRSAFRRVLVLGASAIVTLLAAVAFVAWVHAFTSLSEIKDWVSAAGSVGSMSGVPRVVIGFARAVVDHGQYPALVKRFLMPDPLNPVAPSDLLQVQLAKFVFFYASLAAILLGAFRHPFGRRAVGFLVTFSVPVLLFAALWRGGDLERYMPLLPPLALVVAVATEAARHQRWLRLTLIAAGLVVLVSNGAVLLAWRVAGASRSALQRLPGAGAGDSARLFVVSQWNDPLMQFERNNPQDPLVRRGLTLYPLISPGGPDSPRWREHFAARAARYLANSQPVYVSRRLLASKPRPEWGWVEGDDPSVQWRDFGAFFARLDLDSTAVQSTEEFLLLPPTSRNKAELDSLVAPSAAGRAAGCRFPRR
jgi:4-amino-4-deoxy-L-arabinose transferase-like glycosyltransferase